MLIIMNDNGEIERFCKYHDLSQAEVKKLFHSNDDGLEESPSALLSWFSSVSNRSDNQSANTSEKRRASRKRTNSMDKVESDKRTKNGAELMVDEDRQIGFVPTAVYLWFCRNGGMHFICGMAFLTLLGRAVNVSSTFYLAYWGDKNAEAEAEGNSLSESENLRHLHVLAFIVVSIE